MLAAVAWLGMQSASAHAADAIVRPNQLRQRITGFGASSAWTAPDLGDADADLLFTTDSGVGLSLLRVRIPPGGCSPPDETCEVATALKARARGATVWASPWSPPAAWKSNGDVNHGGTLLPEHADDWAGSLVAFVSWMQGQGVSISYVSAQNEPTTVVDYESCIYSPGALTDFIGNHLGPAFGAANLSTKILAPETQDWGQFPAFANSILGNESASSAVGIIATHSYGNAMPAAYPQAMELWQTEVFDQSTPADPGIGSAIRVALMMNSALVDASVNAWHYWWIRPRGNDNGALWDMATGSPSKRLYAMGNFSRFVRPGFRRVATTTTGPTPGIAFSAYSDPPSGQLVIVAINENSAPVSQAFLFDGVAVGSWMSWVTSSSEIPLSSGSPVAAGANPSELVFSLEAQSVTTLQGLVTGVGPALPASFQTTSAPQEGEATGCACSVVGAGRDGNAVGAATTAIFGTACLGRRRRRRRRGPLVLKPHPVPPLRERACGEGAGE